MTTLVSAALIAAAILGCGGESAAYRGVVRFDNGNPVRAGSVEFRSLADGKRYASRIDRDGSFALADQSGTLRCPPGDYEVVVVQIVLTEDLAAEAHRHGGTVPRRYADYYTSGLRVTNPAPGAPVDGGRTAATESGDETELENSPLSFTIASDQDDSAK